ncbi:hypothetical protein REPUB_Repub14bG0029600 [Reevesia pubescens]
MQCTTAQMMHVVGDDMGWSVPPNGATAYSTWATSKRFMVGDILVFNFTTNEHEVLQVPKASFDACSDDNPIKNMMTNGPANITLNSTGKNYYICTIGQHCQLSQKLAITVSATSGSPLAAPSPTTTPTTPTTPSPTSGAPANCTRLQHLVPLVRRLVPMAGLILHLQLFLPVCSCPCRPLSWV